jgi:hypothetical protein
LFQKPDIDWVSLQVGGDVVGDLNRLRTHLQTIAPNGHTSKISSCKTLSVEDAGSRFQDFADTARAVVGTDQILTVDTAVAHIAGALGHPTTLLLPDPPDWRWGLLSQQSVWYQNHHLNRSRSWQFKNLPVQPI